MDNLRIKRVYDKNSKKEVDISNVTIKQSISPYSNTKKHVWRFFINDEIVRKNNNYHVMYECPTCDRENIVCLNNITRKINNNIVSCNTCKNQDQVKVVQHSEFMKQNASSIRKSNYDKQTSVQMEPVNLMFKLSADEVMFNEMDDEFKDGYFKKHMTKSEFERIRSSIVSFQNGKFTTFENFVYYPCVSIPNQTMFNPYFYDTTRDVLEKPCYIKYKCQNCNSLFVNRDLFIQKNRYKILCQDCGFCNNTFKLRNTKNILGNTILYQSQYELKFVMFCNENGIVIQNGPSIEYIIAGKHHKYKVDFQILLYGYLIELKDNHHWHKKQVQSGKWKLKEKAALDYAERNNMKYIVIYPKDYVEFCKTLVKKAR